MPVNAVSGTLSTSVYLAAMLLLLVVVVVPARAAYDGASQRAAQEVAAGVALQVDCLRPGAESALRVSPMPGTSVTVRFDGDEVTATVNGFSESSSLAWVVVGPVLQGGGSYDVRLEGGVATVA